MIFPGRSFLLALCVVASSRNRKIRPLALYSWHVLDEKHFVSHFAVNQFVHNAARQKNSVATRPHSRSLANLEVARHFIRRVRDRSVSKVIPAEPFARIFDIENECTLRPHLRNMYYL